MAIDWLSAIDIKNHEVRVEEAGEDAAMIVAVEGSRPIILVRGFNGHFNGMSAVEVAEHDIRSVREAAGQLQAA